MTLHRFRNVLLAGLCLCAAPGLLFSSVARAQSNPGDAQTVPGESGVDSDGDGVPDDVDAAGCDPRVSARVYVPADRTYGMLMFEDSWPRRGDFDFNDAVLAYNQVLRYDSAGQLTGLRMELSVLAVGAGDVNGLALRLPNTPRSSVTSLTYSLSNVAHPAAELRLDPNEADATIVLSENLHALFGEGATRPWVNTDPDAPSRPYADLVIEVGFDPGHALSAADAPFDLFIFNRERGTEVHRPRYGATNAMNAALFNTADDGSSSTRRFVTTQGIPFVLELPELTNYPRELSPIDLLYPQIVPFGLSAGTQAQDFYRNPAPGTAFGLTPPRPLAASAASSTACFAPSPGVCGAATGTGSVSAPASGLCDFGTSSTVTASGGMHRWTCAGHYSTPTACTAPQWACQPNLSSTCTVPGGTGTHVCNGSGSGFGACTATACNPGFYLSGGTCVAQVCSPGATQGCAVTHGSGTQTCNNLGSAWGACEVVSCASGYTRNGNVCEAVTFTGLTFTTCGRTGRFGPTQAQCDATYGGGSGVTVSAGIQSWTVPAAGTYRIEAWGAQGGQTTNGGGGRGARMRGDFTFSGGETLRIVVGQMGTTGQGSGGGGGTFVIGPNNTRLVIAGGGGGSGTASSNTLYNLCDASITTSGNRGDGSAYGVGGTNGYGGNGAVSTGHGGGGGFYGNGTRGTYNGQPGFGFLNGGNGGHGHNGDEVAAGGFGGGAGANAGNHSAGGGGYSGGGASGNGGSGTAGGGGSFNAGANPSNSASVQTGHGRVTITRL